MKIAVSVVSHGHGPQVLELLQSLARLREASLSRVVVTINIPEPGLQSALAAHEWGFELAVIRNEHPRGFGANHNAAALTCPQDAFCVMNPDVGLLDNPFPALSLALSTPHCGCAYPLQVSGAGVVQASAREVPVPASLLRRYLGSSRAGGKTLPERVDWVTGACMLFRRDVYRLLGGFDEGYFMYCEDVDICLRMQNLGWNLSPANASVIHVAFSASHRSPRHFYWHVRSLMRLWTSEAFRRFRQARASGALQS